MRPDSVRSISYAFALFAAAIFTVDELLFLTWKIVMSFWNMLIETGVGVDEIERKQTSEILEYVAVLTSSEK